MLGLAPQLMASPGVFVPVHSTYYFPAYRWHAGGWYPHSTVYFPLATTGELKIQDDDKDARVYVDGGYLGTVKNAKKFDLRPGNHNVELRDSQGNVLVKEKVAIVPGHTTVFNPSSFAAD
jgi:hypothetical protein